MGFAAGILHHKPPWNSSFGRTPPVLNLNLGIFKPTEKIDKIWNWNLLTFFRGPFVWKGSFFRANPLQHVFFKELRRSFWLLSLLIDVWGQASSLTNQGSKFTNQWRRWFLGLQMKAPALKLKAPALRIKAPSLQISDRDGFLIWLLWKVMFDVLWSR